MELGRVDKKFHVFAVDDVTHQRSNEIYRVGKDLLRNH